MRMDDCRRLVTVAIIAWISCADQAIALDIVGGGKPLVTIVVEGEDETGVHPPRTGGVRPAVGQRKRGDRAFATDADAANVLIEWVRKMTGATLAISGSAPKEGNAIYIGESAVKAGLRLDQIDSPSREGIRVVADKTRVLVAGQSPQATARAVCRLLEIMGCRYFMDGPLGEVYTKTANLRVASMDVTEKPALLHRRIWGSRWTAPSLWKVWNGAGGIEASGDHAWGRYIPKSLFQTHPEYFAMRNDERRSGDWYCTSNMQLREEFARGVIAAIKNGETSPSISPPDGRGYCECAACKAQDNPQSLEPTTGTVGVTDRYVDFFNDVASRVAKVYPQTVLNFYAYADYTQPPTRGKRLAPNLCVWLAPIRYCRLHAIGDPHCPSRVQLAEMIDGWEEASDRIGYRTYNYNLAECLVPFSLISVWSHDILLLKSKGCFGINNETLASWQIYGPHIYLSARLAYDPAADASAIMDDYFSKFYGPAAGAMKKYWREVDEAFAQSSCHSGGFHGIEPVYSAELVARCERLLASASSAAQHDATVTTRIEMCREGLMNARQYRSIVDALNVGNFIEGQKIASALIARTESQTRAGYGNHYTTDYFRRFVASSLDVAAAALAPPARLVTVLPDKWKMNYDDADGGIARGFAASDHDDSSWREVATFGRTLDAQGLEDRKTILWYRNSFEVPPSHEKLSLLVLEVDGGTTVFINGQEAAAQEKKRVTFEVDVTPHVQPGKNVIAIRVDHRAITELFLGGIVRPIVLIEKIH